MLSYQNFDLRITEHNGGYRSSVISSPTGQANHDFTLPFSPEEMKALRSDLYTSKLELKKVGERLFEAVFGGQVANRLEASWAVVKQQDIGLRISLRLRGVPDLDGLPWEYLYDAQRRHTFALSTQTPIVRYLEVGIPVPTLTVQPPLHMLAVIADPKDLEPRLDVEAEWRSLQNALQGLVDKGMVKLERLERATRSALQNRMRQREPVHILHYIGHGLFSEGLAEGQLVFEDDDGNQSLLSAEVLTILLDDRAPRLVYLNACETAQTTVRDPLVGTAQQLVNAGIPAVIAMQSDILDSQAIKIASEFYRALSDGYPVDAALVEGRVAVYESHEQTDWGTPVLFMRSLDGVLFELESKKGKPNCTDPSAIDINQLTDALLKCESMTNPALRPLVVAGLPPYIRNMVQQINILKPDVRNIAKTCLNYECGIESLLAVMEEYEGEARGIGQLKQFLHLG